jgi:hypothetical protein
MDETDKHEVRNMKIFNLVFKIILLQKFKVANLRSMKSAEYGSSIESKLSLTAVSITINT